MSPSRASIENYHEVVLSGKKSRQQDQIMAWCLKYGDGRVVTRHVISKYTGIAIQSVCGAVNTLIKDGFLVQEEETRPDPITTNPAHEIHVVYPQPERRRFDQASFNF